MLFLASSLDLSHNSLTELPLALCNLYYSLVLIDASFNSLASVPECLSHAGFVTILNLQSNLITSLPPHFFAHETESALSVLDLRDNRINSLEAFRPYEDPDGGGALTDYRGSPARLAELLLSGNQFESEVSDVLARIARTFPNLRRLSLARAGLHGVLPFLPIPNLRELDISDNPDISLVKQGSDLRQILPGASVVKLSGSDVTTLVAYPANMRVLETRGAVNTDCVPSDVLAAPYLAELDVRGARPTTAELFGSGPICRARILERVTASNDSNRAFPHLGGLVCPQWIISDSGAIVRADAPFLRYAGCTCPERHMWRWDAAACEVCPASGPAGQPVRWCDPRADSNAHCVIGNRYPLDRATGRMPALAVDVADAALVDCRRPGACNVGSPCPPSGGKMPPPVGADGACEFECAPGYDADTLLCSGCSPGYWSSGTACLECHGAFVWLVPLSLLLMGALIVYFLLRRAGRPDDGGRAVAIAVLWLQVTAVLDSSVAINSGTLAGSTSTWAWLARARSVAESWAAVEPWAASCVSDSADYLGRSTLLLAAPFAVAAAVAVAAVALPRRWAPRAVYAGVWTGTSLFLPVATRALSLFNCQRAVEGVLFLSAAPYVGCDAGDARFVRARVLAAVALALYAVPFPVFCLWVARRSASSPRAGSVAFDSRSSRRAGQLDAPLLSAGESGSEAGDAGGNADADADGGRAPPGLPDILLPSGRLLIAPVRRRGLYYWLVVYDFGRKAMLASVVGLIEATSPLLPVGVFLVLLVSLLVLTHRNLWLHRSDVIVETVTLSAALGIYLVSIVAGSQTRRGEAAPNGQQAAVTRAFMSLAHVGMLLMLTAYALLAARRRNARERKQAAAVSG